jgi:hypothetical protein
LELPPKLGASPHSALLRVAPTPACLPPHPHRRGAQLVHEADRLVPSAILTVQYDGEGWGAPDELGLCVWSPPAVWPPTPASPTEALREPWPPPMPATLRPVLAWPSSQELRSLRRCPERPRQVRLENRSATHFFDASSSGLMVQATWRYTVVLDDRGVHILDWLPRALWPLARSPKR